MRIFLVLALLLTVVALIFALQNTATAAITFLIWRFESPLALVLIVALVTGALVGFLAMLPGRVRGGLRAGRQARRIAELEKEVADLRARLATATTPPEAQDSAAEEK